MKRLLIIPAAGLGSRLGGDVPKLLAPVNGRPMIDHLLALFEPFVDRVAIVVHPQAVARAENFLETTVREVELFTQPEPTGMLDAILIARPAVERLQPRRVWVVWCDQVALHPQTLARLRDVSDTDGAPAVVLPTCGCRDPYIHLARDAQGRIARVLHRREGDEMPATGETDSGLFDLSREAYLDWLPEYARQGGRGASTRERNFLPFLPWAASRAEVTTIAVTDASETTGVNTPDDLARVEDILRSRGARDGA